MGTLELEDAVTMIKRLCVVLKKTSPNHKIIDQALKLVEGTDNVLRADNILEDPDIKIWKTGIGMKIVKMINGELHTYREGYWHTNEARIFPEFEIPRLDKEEFYPNVEWIEDTYDADENNIGEIAARIFIELDLNPADRVNLYRPIMRNMHVTCTYKRKRYRLVGASTMGDIFLHDVDYPEVTSGWKKRVILNELSDWQYEYKDSPAPLSDKPTGFIITNRGGIDAN